MTLRDLLDAGRQAAKDAWWQARTSYYNAERKLGDLVYGAQQTYRNSGGSGGSGGVVGDVVRESQKGADFMEQNAPKAAENVEKMVQQLKQRPKTAPRKK